MAEHPFGTPRFAARTHVGRKRKGNEDAYLALPQHGVFCVADGMGGAEQGEVASKAAVDALERHVRARPVSRPESCHARGDVVQDALNEASRWIVEYARANGLRSMGTTAIVLAFDGLRPDHALALHAGDSRLYGFRDGTLTQISRDHSLAEAAGVKDESQLAPAFRSVITRSVGINETVKLDRTPVSVREGDLFLLCSDGLTRMASDEVIAGILRDGPASDLGGLADRLVEAANLAGGRDNITVILIRVGAEVPGDSATGLGSDAPATMELQPMPTISDTGGGGAAADVDGLTSVAPEGSFDVAAPRQRVPSVGDDDEPERARRGPVSRQTQLLLGAFILLLLAVGGVVFWSWRGGRDPGQRPARPGDLTWDGRVTVGDGTEDILDQGTAEEPFESRLRAALSTGEWGDLKKWAEAAVERRDALSRKALPMKPPWLDAWRAARTPAEKLRVLIGDAARDACYLSWLAEWEAVRTGNRSPVGSLRERRDRMKAILAAVTLDELAAGFPSGETPEARAAVYCRQARRDQRAFQEAIHAFVGGVRSRNEALWQDPSLLEAPLALGLVARPETLKDISDALSTLRSKADELEAQARRIGDWPTVESGFRPGDLTATLVKECVVAEKGVWDRLQAAASGWDLDPKLWNRWGDGGMARALEMVLRNFELIRERDPAKALDAEAAGKATVETLIALADVHQRVAQRMPNLNVEEAGLALQLGLRNALPAQVMANTEWALFGVPPTSNTLSLAALKLYAQFLRECPDAPTLTNRTARLAAAVLSQAESALRDLVAPPLLAGDQGRELAGCFPPLREAWGGVLDVCASMRRSSPPVSIPLKDLLPRPVVAVWPRPTAKHPWVEYARALQRLKSGLTSAGGAPAPGLSAQAYRARWEGWLRAPQSRVTVRPAVTDGLPRWPVCVAESVAAGERLLVVGAELARAGDETEVRQAWGSTLAYTVINANGRREEGFLRLDPPRAGGVTGLVGLAAWPWRDTRARLEAWRGYLVDALRPALTAAVRERAGRDLLAMLAGEGDPRGLRDAPDLENEWTGFGGAADLQRLVNAFAQVKGSPSRFEASAAGRLDHGMACSASPNRCEVLWREAERVGESLRPRLLVAAKAAIESKVAEHLDALFDQFARFPASELTYLVSDAIAMLAGVDRITGSLTKDGAESVLGRRLLRFADDAYFQVDVLCAGTAPAAQTVKSWPWMQDAVERARARHIERNKIRSGDYRRGR